MSDAEDRTLLSKSSVVLERHRKSRKCVTSKSAILVLVWTFFVTLVHSVATNLSSYKVTLALKLQLYIIAVTIFLSFVQFFYPVGGLLADLKFGRYKTITSSIWMVIISTPLVIFGSGLLVTSANVVKGYSALISTGSLLAITGLLLVLGSVIAFRANVIQFGLDQLYDSPTEDQIIFIQWYMWTYYSATLISTLLIEASDFGDSYDLVSYYYTMSSVFSIISVFLIVLLCIAHKKTKWFMLNNKLVNPYKLVYLVTKFARKHKTPINRSAFTYCEDEIPSGLDLGKSKYGGPFTTEQVEDVKALYGILKILFSVGPFFSLVFATSKVSSVFKGHVLKSYYYNFYQNEHSITSNIWFMMIDGYLLYYLEIVILFPLHIIVVRPFVSYFIPGTRIRMGMGILVLILMLAVSLGMEVIAHQQDSSLQCMLSTDVFKEYLEGNRTSDISPVVASFIYVIVIQQSLCKLFELIVLIAMYELILAQSPLAMKGLIIGLSFAIQGTFKLLGSLLFLPFVLYWKEATLPSCGTIYFSVNIIIGIISLLAYIYRAKNYQNRIRDEPCHVRHYVEEYYSKIPHYVELID